MVKEINKQKWYRPREIAKLGLITNSTGGDNEDSNYNFILNLIKAGRLRAKDYSVGGSNHYWLVPLSEIERYHQSFTDISND